MVIFTLWEEEEEEEEEEALRRLLTLGQMGCS